MKKDTKDAFKVLAGFGISIQDIAVQLHRPANEIKDWLGEKYTKKHFALVSGAIMEIVKKRHPQLERESK